MSLSSSALQKVQNLAQSIIDLITTHENITASSSQKGHTQAGGTPQTIGDSLAAGTDNGYYARADHVHTVDYSKIQNVPLTFTPESHTHTKANIADYFKSDEIKSTDSLNDYKTEGLYYCSYINATQSELPSSVNNIGYSLIIIMNTNNLRLYPPNALLYWSIRQFLITDTGVIFTRIYYEKKANPNAVALESGWSDWVSWKTTDTTYNADNTTLQVSNYVFSIKNDGITNGKIADNTIELGKLNSSSVIDTTPTNNSNKLVTSGGVYTYIDNIIGDIDDWLVS